MLPIRSAISSFRNRALLSSALSTPSLRTRNMSSSQPGPVELSIRDKLSSLLHPSDLIITNDSWQHRHHAAMKASAGGNGETHFSIDIVSDAFKGKSTMQRHRMIYAALSGELEQGLHALSLKTKTPEEAQKSAPAQ